MLGSDITHGELLGITTGHNKYSKLGFNVRHVELINKHLADAVEAACEKDEVSVTSENTKLCVDEKYHQENRNMLRKHEDIWPGKLGRVYVTEHRIYLVTDGLQFTQAPY